MSASTMLVRAHSRRVVHETYFYHPSAHSWNVTLESGAILASAPIWAGQTWQFKGTTIESEKTMPFRMTFTYLDDDTFRRVFEHFSAAVGWQVYAGELCHRAPKPI